MRFRQLQLGIADAALALDLQLQLGDRAVAKLKLEIERQGGVGNPELELPEAHIRGDVDTPWRCIGGAIYNMQMAGFAKVGFISEPPPGSGVERM